MLGMNRKNRHDRTHRKIHPFISPIQLLGFILGNIDGANSSSFSLTITVYYNLPLRSAYEVNIESASFYVFCVSDVNYWHGNYR